MMIAAGDPDFCGMGITIDNKLVAKYNLPVPRYTSYPTVPFWKEGLDKKLWEETFTRQFAIHNKQEGISLYLHLPFCESLCTYCGCNKKITTNHSVEEEYLAALTREWQLYRDTMKERPLIREIHLGGGTPTFFSPRNLAGLLDAIYRESIIHPQHEFSIEGHPNNTTTSHLQTLFDLGFRRISYGVQDNDPDVQYIINRIQPLENVRKATESARKIGFQSVNFDLIYGLPKQTMQTMERTILQTLELKPDRIAFYSYAHVPWTSRGQRLFDENDLPSAEVKMQLYLLGKQLFTQHGYVDIGMDHFALPSDDLYIAREEGRLHRNFMGYTTQRTSMLLGLGVSSISDAGTAFAQNHKTIQQYYESVNNKEFAVAKGYFLNEEDVSFRQYILNISCKGFTPFNPADTDTLKKFSFPELKKLEADGLLSWNEQQLTVTERGMHFIRNICRAFDLHLLRNESSDKKPQYSKAI
ncbi:MAG: oxygen-independent coproporphyrinogen III oxidase [Bacteroidota bacterium]|nr:oxygen-independent coproporphyrinogen III oxidase [Bacteroidota bacterium]